MMQIIIMFGRIKLRTLSPLAFLLIVIVGFFDLVQIAPAQPLFTLRGTSATLTLTTGATFYLDGGFQFTNSSVRINGTGNLYVGGDWTNNGSYNFSTTSTVTFVQGLTQNLTGANITTFANLTINKSGSDTVRAQKLLYVGGNLRFLSNSILDIQTNNLTLDGYAYSDTSNGTYLFAANRCILEDGSLTSGQVIKRFLTVPDSTIPNVIPLGTPGAFASAEVQFSSGVNFSTSSQISVRAVASEHPQVQTTSVSLHKYWQLAKTNITFNTVSTVNFLLKYSVSDIYGVEINYKVLKYAPSTWKTNPGAYSNGVLVAGHTIDCQGVYDVDFNADWTAGELPAVRKTYYSITTGNFHVASTWSLSRGGPAAPNPPNAQFDAIYITSSGSVTLTQNVTTCSYVLIESGARFDMGLFTVSGNNYQDTFNIQAGGRVGIGDPNGISSAGTTSGNVLMTYRTFSTDGVYIYTSTSAQVSGTGLPSQVRSLVIEKPNGTGTTNTITLSADVQIGDSLIVTSGRFNLGNYSADGQTSGKKFVMNGGEILIPTTFPTDYSAPTFTAGTVNFNGSGAQTVPSTNSLINVLQYNNLTISGTYGDYSTVTFRSDGEVRIGGSLAISTATFTAVPATSKFVVDGTTINFNGTTGTQSIPRYSASAASGAIYQLQFNDLKFSGAATKQLVDAACTVASDLTLAGGNLSLNGYDLEVQGNWLNSGGTFTPGTNKVIFNVLYAPQTNTITSNGQPFYSISIQGVDTTSVVQYLDNLTMTGNVTIGTVSAQAKFYSTNSNITIAGNWTNNGLFTTASLTTITFNGSTTQTVSKSTAGAENFGNMTLSKSGGDVVLSSNVIVNGNLIFTSATVCNVSSRAANATLSVVGQISPTTGTLGFVDGNLGRYITAAATTSIFVVGVETTAGANFYRPALLTFVAGGAGYCYVNCTSQVLSAANITAGGLDPNKNVPFQWLITNTVGRNFDLVLNFSSSADIRGGALTYLFETHKWNGTVPLNPHPNTGTRGTNYTQSLANNNVTGTYMVGEPLVLSFYTIASGTWSTVSIWSNAYYNSSEVATRAPGLLDNVYIGDGKLITVSSNLQMNNTLATITVDAATGTSNLPGTLYLDGYTISGTSGNFTVSAGATLRIGDAGGIASGVAATGNIRMAAGTRTYYAGNYIYNFAGAQAAGTGLPATIQSLVVTSSSILSLPSNLAITGNLSVQTSSTLKITGTGTTLSAANITLYTSATMNCSSSSITVTGTILVGNSATFYASTATIGVATVTISSTGTLNAWNSTLNISGVLTIVSTGTLSCVGANINMTGTGAIWNDAGTFTCGTGDVTFTGATPTITDATGETFYNLVSQQTGVLNLAAGTNIQVNGILLLNSASTKAYIDCTTNNVTVTIGSGTYTTSAVQRTGYGHIDGALRKWVLTTNNLLTTYELGTHQSSYTNVYYTPAILKTINASGGTAGYITMICTQATASSLPPFWNTLFSTASMDTARTLYRYFTLINGGYIFNSGFNQIDLTLAFIDTLDIRGGGVAGAFDVATTTTGSWSLGASATNATGSVTETSLMVGGIQELAAGPNYFVIGTVVTTGSRTFYSRASGNFSSSATWSSIAYGGAATTASVNPPLATDVFYIGSPSGAGYTINLDQTVTIDAVVIDTLGVLMTNDKLVNGNQFILKGGGTLGVGDANGVWTSGNASGNIRTSIRDYNYDGNNNASYIYTGTTANQSTGDGMASVIGSMEIRATNCNVSLVQQITMQGNMLISGGTLIPTTNSTITINGYPQANPVVNGNWTNNSPNVGFTTNSTTNSVIFGGSLAQTISGTKLTTFGNLTVSKTGGGLQISTSAEVDGTMNFSVAGLAVLSTPSTLYFGTNASCTGAFSGTTMIQVAGVTTATGYIVKKYAGTLPQTITIPIGVGAVYNGAAITVNSGTTLANPASLYLKLNATQHPARLTNNILSKYWNITTSGITATSASLSFTYAAGDVTGVQGNYIPANYQYSSATTGSWEVNLGTARIGSAGVVSITSTTTATGDWTAGEPASIFSGRKFYSSGGATTSGNWSDPTRWSNITYASTSLCAYSPGTFPRDTVFIDKYNVNMDVATVVIDSLAIGSATNTTGSSLTYGGLTFATATNKSLTVMHGLYLDKDGLLTGVATGTRLDTLTLYGDVANNATNASCGINLYQGTTQKTKLVLLGTTNTVIYGSGNWGNLDVVEITKSGATGANVLINQSVNFSANTGRQTTAVISLLDGVYRHDNANTLSTQEMYLAPISSSATYTMTANTGIEIYQGSVRTPGTFNTNTNNYLSLYGGTFNIGDANNENFAYKDGTILNMSGGTLNVAGAFTRLNPTSTIVFTMTSGTVQVVTSGSTVSGTYGFDVSQLGSTFNWTGGTIILAHPPSTDLSYNVNASTYSVTNCTLQAGVTGNLLTSPQNYAIQTYNVPLYNLIVQETRRTTTASTGATIISGGGLTINNDITIATTGSFDLNSYDVTLMGNFTNSGKFTPDGPASGSGGSRHLNLYGSTDQTITIVNTIASVPNSAVMQNEAFYEVHINKPSGRVVLGTTANSDIIVRNILVFELGNATTAIIEARTNNNMVIVTTQSVGDLASVQRLGGGYVNGWLRRNIGTGTQSVQYDVGSTTAYLPVTLATVGSGGTSNFAVDAITYAGNYPSITSNGLQIDLTKNIQRYWTITTATPSFLGTRTFKLSTTFLNPGDIRNSANPGVFIHYRPVGPPWVACTAGVQADTYTQSINHPSGDFGDFVLAEVAGRTYYSKTTGNWNSNSTWSQIGWNGAAASSYPSGVNDTAYVGNGKTVTITTSLAPIQVIRVVDAGFVDNTSTASATSGTLNTLSNSYIFGNLFELATNCTFSTQNQAGFYQTLNNGAVQTTNRIFGTSNYVFNRNGGSQYSGDGVPNIMKTLTLANPSGTVYLEKDVTTASYTEINVGYYDISNRIFTVGGDFILTSVTLASITGNGTLVMASTANQKITLNNSTGITFYNLNVSKPSGTLIVTGASASNNVTIQNALTFLSGNNAALDVRTQNRKVIMSSVTTAVINSGATIAHVDGTMERPVATTGNFYATFEIGVGNIYAPVIVTSSSGSGSIGAIDAIVYTATYAGNAVTSANRFSVADAIPEYWHLTNASGYTTGTRTLNTTFQFPVSQMIAGANYFQDGVIRRLGIPTENPQWSQRANLNLSWTTSASVGTVQLTTSATWWAGVGDFYISDRSNKIFYSRADGNWATSASWSFTSHLGSAVPSGEFPNFDWQLGTSEVENRDIVYIGNGNTITLNSLPEISLLNVTSASTLVVPDGYYIKGSSDSTNSVYLRTNSNFENRTALGIEPGNNGILRFTDANRTFDPGANYIFSSSTTTATSQYFGGAFPSIVNNITINATSATVNINTTGTIVNGTLLVNTGILQFSSTNAYGTASNQTLTLNGTLQISGSTATFTVSTTGTAPRNHTLNVNSNVVNNGTWQMLPVLNSGNYVAETYFTSTASQTITGTGTTNLGGVTLTKGSITSVVDCGVNINLSRATTGDAIIYSNGTWRQSAGTLTFDNGTTAANQTIRANGSLQITGNSVIALGTANASNLVISGGEFIYNSTTTSTIGTSTANLDNVVYTTTAGSRFKMYGSGTLNVNGGIGGQTGSSSEALAFSQTAGTLELGTISGYSNSSVGLFDVSSPSSSFTISGGTLILTRANATSSAPAEFNVSTATINASGGTVQFGDGTASSPSWFDYDVPSLAIFYNDFVVNNTSSATVSPARTNEILRMGGNLTVTAGSFDTRTTPSGSTTSTSEAVIIAGNTSATQTISTGSSGTVIFHNLTMSRQGTGGTLPVQMNASAVVSNIMNFAENTTTTANQIIQLGTGMNFTVTNASPTAVTNAGISTSSRYIQTSTTSGYFVQQIATTTSSASYLFPVGTTGTIGTTSYSPATYLVTTTSGVTGTLGIIATPGQGTSQKHLYLGVVASGQTAPTDYLNRYWSVTTSSALTVPGTLTFSFDNSQVLGTKSNFTGVGRYRPQLETAGGSWSLINGSSVGTLISTSANTFSSVTNASVSTLFGDWTVANYSCFLRTFYSKASTSWSTNGTWSFTSHSGSSVPVNVYPSLPEDRAIIGTSNTVTLNVSPSIRDVYVGTSSGNIGTLLISNGQYLAGLNQFSLGTSSTLNIADAAGIESGTTTGVIQFPDALRNFDPTANYIFSCTTTQSFGLAFPTVANNITQTGSATSLTKINRDGITVNGSLIVTGGTLEFAATTNFTMTLNGNLLINSANSSKFTVETTGLTPLLHQLNVNGNVVNAGTWNMSPVVNNTTTNANVTFGSTATQTITGAGTNNLFSVTLTKGSTTSILRVSSSVGVGIGGGVPNAITWTAGTWQQTTGTLTFDNGVNTTNHTITANGSLQITGNGILSLGASASDGCLILDGGEFVYNSSGTSNIGNSGSGNSNSVLFTSTPGSRFSLLSGGTINIGGGICPRLSETNATLAFTFSGTGTINLGKQTGFNRSDAGIFDLGKSGSTFNMSAGTLILARANTSATAPADFNVSNATINASGGTVQFGDGTAAVPSWFDYDVPSTAIFYNNFIVNNTASCIVSPANVTEVIRMGGNLTVTAGSFDARTTPSGSATSTSEAVIIAGNTTATQTITTGASGSVTFHNLTMSRQGTGGTFDLQMNASAFVSNILNFAENPATTANQIIQLGAGKNLTVTNSSPSAVTNAGISTSSRYIQTSLTSGYFTQQIATTTSSASYLFPVGTTGTIGTTSYSPATYLVTTTSGVTGTLGIIATPGQGTSQKHLYLGVVASGQTAPTDYLNRYWSVTTSSALAVPGTLTFSFDNTQVLGTKSNFTGVGRYRPQLETAGGSWSLINGTALGTLISTSANTFSSVTNASVSTLFGDWTVANYNCFLRTFYSIANSNWSTNSTWSFTSHSGTAVGTNIYPSMPEDRAIIGTNNTVTLNVSPSIRDVYVGTSSGNIGTLLIGSGQNLSGINIFSLSTNSTLNIADATGIESGTVSGVLRFTDIYRNFDPTANYIFSSTGTQVFGLAFPTLVNNVTVTSTSISNMNRDGITVNGSLIVTSGTLQFASTTNYTLTLNGNLLINSIGTFTVATTGVSPLNHQLNLNGNVVNAGNWWMRPVLNGSSTGATITFGSTATQTISGAGTNNLYSATLAKGTTTSILQVSSNIGISDGATNVITWTAGTWQQTSGTLTFDNGATTRTQTITTNGSLQITGNGNLVTGTSLATNFVIGGGEFLLNTSGAATIGGSSSDGIEYNASPNSRMTIQNGTLTVAGRIARPTSTTTPVLNYTQSGGTVIVGAVGHASGTLGTFDLGSNSGSSFTMSGGTIILRNPTTSTPPNTAGSFLINASASVNVSGGTIQFGDAGTASAKSFDYDVPPTAAFWNWTVGSSRATVNPYNTNEVLRLQGNLTVTSGTFDATQTSIAQSGANQPTITTEEVAFQGVTSSSQIISSTGVLKFNNLTLNRQGTAGATSSSVLLNTSATVYGVVNLRENSTTAVQAIELGVGVNLTVTSSSISAITNGSASPNSYIRTSTTSGLVLWNITQLNSTYNFPVGSYDYGLDNYTPAQITTASSGTGDYIGVRVSRGTNSNNGHLQLVTTSSRATDFLTRYWTITTTATLTISGQWKFSYLDTPASEIYGSESNLTSIGRWRPIQEGAGASSNWVLIPGTVSTSANCFYSPSNYAPLEFSGDWTLANNSAFRRIFYSLVNGGQWSTSSSWTFSPTFIGAIAGAGIYPNDPLDSAVIGNGHTIILDNSYNIGGVAVGTYSSTATLDCSVNTLTGNYFTMYTNATLYIGSPYGITTLATSATAGNIQSGVRTFVTTGNYAYTGVTNQSLGNALPSTMASLIINNSGASSSNTVAIDRNLTATQTFTVTQGTVNMQTYSVNAVSTSALFTLGVANMQIGGTSNMSTDITGYGNYFIDANSTVEFNGVTSQTISTSPNSGLGYGNVIVSQNGQKLVTSPVNVRGAFSVQNGASFLNTVGVNSLHIWGSVYVNGSMCNDGIIEVGP